MALHIDKHACLQNHRCPLLRICPTEAISQNGNNLPVIDESKCIECGKRIQYCGMGAINKKQ